MPILPASASTMDRNVRGNLARQLARIETSRFKIPIPFCTRFAKEEATPPSPPPTPPSKAELARLVATKQRCRVTVDKPLAADHLEPRHKLAARAPPRRNLPQPKCDADRRIRPTPTSKIRHFLNHDDIPNDLDYDKVATHARPITCNRLRPRVCRWSVTRPPNAASASSCSVDS
mmetsp:Transcript_9905/g.25177  ORF Transcript_9905/g.25177 Transcript_9905/m.25177 type:complete len:175 (+) Transcript_9905:224-748(+)